MEYKKIYLTISYDNKYIVKFRDCRIEELTSFENSQNKKYVWVRMWNKERTRWYRIEKKYLKKVPSTHNVVTKSTSGWSIHNDLKIENEYIIKQVRKEKIIKINGLKFRNII